VSKALGALFAAAGFLLAVPAAYLVATMSDEEFIRLARWSVVVLLVVGGSILTATGIIILRGLGGRSGEE